MNTYKEIAYTILREAGKPLHSKEITRIAQARGWLKTAAKTPQATMNAQLIVDVNMKNTASRFEKVGPSKFTINKLYKTSRNQSNKQEKVYEIQSKVSSQLKGNIAEARVAELITLYGDTALSCYKPMIDDEGIDLIVKEKGSLKTIYLQVKSSFSKKPTQAFNAKIKTSQLIEHHAMAIVFCWFDIEEGDLWNYLWYVPACSFIKKATRLDGGKTLSFVAGKNKKETNKWDEFLIDKRELANKIIASIKQVY